MGVGVVGLLRSGGAEKLWGKTGSKTGQKTVGRSIRGTVGSSGEGALDWGVGGASDKQLLPQMQFWCRFFRERLCPSEWKTAPTSQFLLTIGSGMSWSCVGWTWGTVMEMVMGSALGLVIVSITCLKAKPCQGSKVSKTALT